MKFCIFTEVKIDLSESFRKLKVLIKIDMEIKNYINQKYLLMRGYLELRYFAEIEFHHLIQL